MKLKLYENGTTAEVLMIGKLDSVTSPEVEKALLSQSEKYDRLILNLSELEYISSAGLRVLKILHITMHKKGGSLILKNTREALMEVFEMTGFAGLLSFE